MLLGRGGADAVLSALDAYRNPDGGYGWGIEPDLRAWESQPAGAMHALEVLAEVGPTTSARSVELCDWLTGITLPDGGLPFTLPVSDPAGCAPFWLGSDLATSSLQMTAQVVANALRVAKFDSRVANHPWVTQATDWCIEAVEGLGTRPSAHELLFSLRFVDALVPIDPHTAERLGDRLVGFIPSDGVVPVEGGAPDEALRALDLAPGPGLVRGMIADEVIAPEMDKLARGQAPDGGWSVDFSSYSAAAALEWRGYATVAAVATLLTS